MIDPRLTDLGRAVLYRASYPGAVDERGFINGYNSRFVFVRFGHSTLGQAVRRQDLRWESPAAIEWQPGDETARSVGRDR